MRITSLELRDFRNHEHLELGEISALTVLVGANGAGKTNVLEAIHLLTAANSFRHAQISQVIRQGERAAYAQMDMTDGNRQLSTSLLLEGGKRRYKVNGKAKAAADVRGLLPGVAFVPDDLNLAKRSSSVRRAALDDLGSQISKSYYTVARDYEKALRYKNRLLRDEEAQMLVDAIDDTLLTCASQLFCFRHSLFEKMNALTREKYGELTGSLEGFEARYLPSWEYLAGNGLEWGNGGEGGCATASYERSEVRELTQRALEEHAGEERARHKSLVGPHNDKIGFFLDGRDVSSFASQGQQRSIVLAWKLAEVEMVRRTVGTDPVLLLDDVMSELDAGRRELLVSTVGDELQTFMTATDLTPFNKSLLLRANVVNLREGAW